MPLPTKPVTRTPGSPTPDFYGSPQASPRGAPATPSTAPHSYDSYVTQPLSPGSPGSTFSTTPRKRQTSLPPIGTEWLNRILLIVLILALVAFSNSNTYHARYIMARINLPFIVAFISGIAAVAVAARYPLVLLGMPINMLSFVAGLLGVFLSRIGVVIMATCLVLSCTGVPILGGSWGSSLLDNNNKRDAGYAFGLIVTTALTYMSWGFYRDVFVLVSDHTGDTTAPLFACALLAFQQVIASQLAAVTVGGLWRAAFDGRSRASEAGRLWKDCIQPSLAPVAVKGVLMVVIISVAAMRRGFPGRRSWLWGWS